MFPKETKCIIYYIYRPINEIYQEGYFLVNTEILRLDHETDPQHAFVLIIFQKVLTVTIIILQEEILVLVIIKLIAQLDLSVKAEPSLSFGQDNPAVKAPVVCPVNVAEDIPKSFVVCQGADGMTVYLSQMSPQTLFKRFLEAI